MAIAIALPGFSHDRERSVTTFYLLMDHFLHQFSAFSQKKNGENLSARSMNFSQNAPSNSVLFSSLFMLLEGLRFVKT